MVEPDRRTAFFPWRDIQGLVYGSCKKAYSFLVSMFRQIDPPDYIAVVF